MRAHELSSDGPGSPDPSAAPEFDDGPTAREVLMRLAVAHPDSERLADDLARVRELDADRIHSERPTGVLTPSQWTRYLRSIAQFPAQATGARSTGAPHWND